MSSDLPISSPYRSTPDAPVTEAERDQLSSRLNAAYTAGTLDAEDYQARLDTLFAAQRLGQLVPVVQGLPPLQTYADPAIVASPRRPPGRGVGGAERERGGPGRGRAGCGLVVLLIAILLVFLL